MQQFEIHMADGHAFLVDEPTYRTITTAMNEKRALVSFLVKEGHVLINPSQIAYITMTFPKSD